MIDVVAVPATPGVPAVKEESHIVKGALLTPGSPATSKKVLVSKAVAAGQPCSATPPETLAFTGTNTTATYTLAGALALALGVLVTVGAAHLRRSEGRGPGRASLVKQQRDTNGSSRIVNSTNEIRTAHPGSSTVPTRYERLEGCGCPGRCSDRRHPPPPAPAVLQPLEEFLGQFSKPSCISPEPVRGFSHQPHRVAGQPARRHPMSTILTVITEGTTVDNFATALAEGKVKFYRVRENDSTRHIPYFAEGTSDREVGEWVLEQREEGVTMKALAKEMHQSIPSIRRLINATLLAQEVEEFEQEDIEDLLAEAAIEPDTTTEAINDKA